MHRTVSALLLFAVFPFMTGCATLFSGSTDTVEIESEPRAEVLIDGKRFGKTPVEAPLDRGDPHKVRLKKEGYETYEHTLTTGFNSVFLLNLISPLTVFGMGIDLITGATHSVEPDNLDVELSKRSASRTIADNQSQKSTQSQEQTQTPSPSKPTFESVVDTEIPATNMSRPNAVAVVIGIKSYENQDVPPVEYAVRDAKIMKKYLTHTLGFKEENIIYVENASGADMQRIFGTNSDPKGQLHDWVKPNESEVFVYYSGHGAPNPESGSTYFIPSDTNPNYLSQNGYPVNQFYENLAQLPATSVTVVLEACFSGISEGGTIVQDVSPAMLSVENPILGMENGLAFSAGAADQVSTWYNEKKHGLFTYYFLQGLRGKADANENSAVTAGEMKSYLSEQVPYRAQRMHSRKQTPQVVGQNLSRVLVRYEDEAPAQ